MRLLKKSNPRSYNKKKKKDINQDNAEGDLRDVLVDGEEFGKQRI